ncbi:cyclohexa-1,5-dienecarbonyl-CoA hydratase [Desulfoprunum benzoelyticum]|uniref:Cyclohexa-1,5-dienecarbonyl-CoA hydratase n=1 Tax=Desulfoprunum benzoelyticum TaxID=1506996 RepID=A0A840UV57_9BACT|nr:enoyl-CoA hydratase/isomerase family protein [Desulfoprunum benzoelyticum]MBB5348723.1 cyclohexa-1,5-dienecarbonyl-CoA hydratase [Desulfoprunum benzoelyticum]
MAMMQELTAILADLNADAELKCVVIAAQGASWCAGVEVLDHKPDLAPDMIRIFDALLKQIHALSVPSIAAVNGACLGGGMEVAIACDMVVAARSAVFGQPEIKLGFLPPYAAVRLPRLVGPSRAIEICTTGKRYSAESMQQMGVVCDVFDDDALEKGVANLTKEIQHASPLIIRLNKKAVNQHVGMAIDDAMESVNDIFLNQLMHTEDTLEGLKSFEEKRRPEWKNR